MCIIVVASQFLKRRNLRSSNLLVVELIARTMIDYMRQIKIETNQIKLYNLSYVYKLIR